MNAVARHHLSFEKIRIQWPDMLRVAGSLHTGTVACYDLLPMLGRDGNPSPLGAAFAEYCRAAKTLHLLAMCDRTTKPTGALRRVRWPGLVAITPAVQVFLSSGMRRAAVCRLWAYEGTAGAEGPGSAQLPRGVGRAWARHVLGAGVGVRARDRDVVLVGATAGGG